MKLLGKTILGLALVGFGSILLQSCGKEPAFDIIIRGGTVYDGNGSSPFVGDVAINADTIVVLGKTTNVRGRREINATGLAVAPGFINMLSWADESLIIDGKDRKSVV